RPRLRGRGAESRGAAGAGGHRGRGDGGGRQGGGTDRALRRVRSGLVPRRPGRRPRGGRARDVGDRRALPRAHQDQDRDLARPRGAQAQDRGGRPARHAGAQGRERGHRDAADPPARRADPGSRGGPTPDGLGQPRAARRPRGRSARVRGAHWAWADPREAALLPAVSADSLMAHARAIATWERESGSPGEARAFDYIESCLKRYGLEVERREIEAYISLPLESRVVLPDGTA